MTQDADSGRRRRIALSGYLPAGGGIVAGLLLLFAVAVQRQGLQLQAAVPYEPTVRQAATFQPVLEPAPKPTASASKSIVPLPPNPAATEFTWLIEAGLPLSDPPPKPVVVREVLKKQPQATVDNRPRIAVVIYYMGYDRVNTARAA